MFSTANSACVCVHCKTNKHNSLVSPLFSFFLCSHYISFPLPIVNLLFFDLDLSSHCPHLIIFSYSPLPSIFFHSSHPSLLIPHPNFPFLPHPTFSLSTTFALIISPSFILLFTSTRLLLPVLPLQGVGSDDGRGTEHTDPPQRGSSSFALRQRPDGHLLQGPFYCRLGHGLSYWHKPTSCPCGTPGCCQRGRLWRQIYRVSLRGPHHQGNNSSQYKVGFECELMAADPFIGTRNVLFCSFEVFLCCSPVGMEHQHLWVCTHS